VRPIRIALRQSSPVWPVQTRNSVIKFTFGLHVPTTVALTRCAILSLMPNSHRHNTVRSVSCLNVFRLQIFYRRQSWIQFTPPKRTRHRQDRFVVSGVEAWISFKTPYDQDRKSQEVGTEMRRNACNRRTWRKCDIRQTTQPCLRGSITTRKLVGRVGLGEENVSRVSNQSVLYCYVHVLLPSGDLKYIQGGPKTAHQTPGHNSSNVNRFSKFFHRKILS